MSDFMYWHRLRWEAGHGGVAKLHGKAVPLSSPPDLGCGGVWEIDYCPGHGIAKIQPLSVEPPRDMTAEEKAAADALMERLTGLR